MTLRYLDFDYSEDDEGTGTWDAMACVTLQHLPALHAELQQVLGWAHAEFAGQRGPIEDGGAWDYDLQGVQEWTVPEQLDYDEGTDTLTLRPGPATPARHTLTLSLSGTPAFGAALRQRFGLE